MSLRRSPLLTPRALAARRANALKSTGPRTAQGKARSCLNALRHGRRARDLRAKIDRMGDSEALFLLDWFHDRILQFYPPHNERRWNYTVRLAGRVWCFMTGRSQRSSPRTVQIPPGQPAAHSEPLVPRPESRRRSGAKPSHARPFYQYGQLWPCPRYLQIAYKRGPGIRFVNPTPFRRKHALMGWLPQFQSWPGPPPKVKRVRRPAGSEATKNQVRMNLQYGGESSICLDFERARAEAPIKLEGDSLPAGLIATDRGEPEAGTELTTVASRGIAGAADFREAPVEFADDESFASSELSDQDAEPQPSLHPLVRWQWAKCRKVLARRLSRTNDC
jgi:hypothetical protein